MERTVLGSTSWLKEEASVFLMEQAYESSNSRNHSVVSNDTMEFISLSDSSAPVSKWNCLITAYGDGYRGTMNKSLTGLKCKNWKDTREKKQVAKEKYRDRYGLHKNYCRRWGNKGPWCFVTYKKKQLCRIPLCKKSSSPIDLKGQTMIKRGRTVGYLVSYINYVVEFKMKIYGFPRSWANVLSFITKFDGHSRLPSVNFKKKSMRVYQTAKQEIKVKFDFKTQKEYTIRIEVVGTSMKVFVDGKVCGSRSIRQIWHRQHWVQVWVSDPWHTAVNGMVYNLTYTKGYPVNFTAANFGLMKRRVVRGHILGRIKTEPNFFIEATVKIVDIIKKWGNIFMITNGKGSKVRLPSLYTFPRKSMLHGTAMDKHGHVKNCDCDRWNPPFRKAFNLKIRVVGRHFNMLINDVVCCAIMLRYVMKSYDAAVFVSGPYDPAAHALVWNMRYSKLKPTSPSGRYKKIGNFNSIDVDPFSGQIWAVDKAGGLQRSFYGQAFKPVSGMRKKVATVSLSANRVNVQVYITTTSSEVFHFFKGKWKKLNKKMKSISVSTWGKYVWGITGDNKVYLYDVGRRRWYYAGRDMIQISAAQSKLCWSVHKSGILHYYERKFHKVGVVTGAKWVSVSSNGRDVYYVSPLNFLFYFGGWTKKGNWRYVDAPQPKKAFVTNNRQDIVVITKSSETFYFKRSGQNSTSILGLRRLNKKASFTCVSVSGDGHHVWGTDKNGNVWYRGGVAGVWQLYPRLKLKQVSVSHNGNTVWGVSKSGSLWYLGPNGVLGKWKSIPGKGTQISVSGDGKHIWVLNKQLIYYKNSVKSSFRRLRGNADQISVNYDGKHVYFVRQHNVYYRKGATNAYGQLYKKLKVKVKYISVSGDGKSVWAIFVNGLTYYRRAIWPETVSWQHVQMGENKVQLSVSHLGDVVWSTGKSSVDVRSVDSTQLFGTFSEVQVSGDGKYLFAVRGQVFYQPVVYNMGIKHNKWKSIKGGTMKQISVSYDGSFVVALNTRGYLYFLDGLKGSWKVKWKRPLRSISISHDGIHLWMSDKRYRPHYSLRQKIKWRHAKDSSIRKCVRQVSVVDEYNVFIIACNKNVYYRNGYYYGRDHWTLIHDSKNIVYISTPTSGQIWGITSGNRVVSIDVHRKPRFVDGVSFKHISADANGHLYGVDPKNHIYLRRGKCDIKLYQHVAEGFVHILPVSGQKTSNYLECQEKCYSISHCRAWVYYMSTGKCMLSSQKGKIKWAHHSDGYAGYSCFDSSPCPNVCAPGHYCPQSCGIKYCKGRYSLYPAPSKTVCQSSNNKCGKGSYCPGFGRTSKLRCTPGFYCPKIYNPDRIICPKQFYCPDYSRASPLSCPDSKKCPRAGLANAIPCKAGHYCMKGIEKPCPKGNYCHGGIMKECPKFHFCPPKSDLPTSCSYYRVCPSRGNDLTRILYNKWILCAKTGSLEGSCPAGSSRPGKKIVLQTCNNVCSHTRAKTVTVKKKKKKSKSTKTLFGTFFDKWYPKESKKKVEAANQNSARSIMDVTAPKCIQVKDQKTKKILKHTRKGYQVIAVSRKDTDEYQFGHDGHIEWSHLVISPDATSVRRRNTQLILELKRRPKKIFVRAKKFSIKVVLRLNFRCAVEGKLCKTAGDAKTKQFVFFGIGGQYNSFIRKGGNFMCTAPVLCGSKTSGCLYYKGKKRDCYSFPECDGCNGNVLKRSDATGSVIILNDQKNLICGKGYTCFSVDAFDTVVIDSKRLFVSTINQYTLNLDSSIPSVYNTSSSSYFKAINLEDCDVSDQLMANPAVLHVRNKGVNKAHIRHPIISISHPDLEVAAMWICSGLDSKAKSNFGKSCNSVKPGHCRPQNFKIIVSSTHPREVRFSWRKGCEKSKAFRMRHTNPVPGRTKVWSVLGGNFLVGDATCTNKVEAGNQWVDDDPSALFSFGTKQLYCLSGINPKTSETCASRIVEWNGTAVGKMLATEGGNTGIAGVLVHGYLCPLKPPCLSKNPLQLGVELSASRSVIQSFSSPLPEGHRVSFDIAIKNPKYQLRFDDIKQECPTVSSKKWDFQIHIVNSYLKIVWNHKFPLCWLVLKKGATAWNKVSDIRHAKYSMGASFDRHFEIVFVPSKKWMAKNCRLACGLCSSCPNTIGDTYCDRWKKTYPKLCQFSGYFPTSLSKAAHRFLDIADFTDQVGTLINTAQTDCDYLQHEWAFFDPYNKWSCCLNNNEVTVFDHCNQYFTKCKNRASRPSKGNAYIPDEAIIQVYSQSTSNTHDNNRDFLTLTIPLLSSIAAHTSPESARKYSSILGNDHVGKGHARSMLDSPQAWSSKKNKIGEWMQIDLGSVKLVSAVVTQGRHKCIKWRCSEWVTSFIVKISKDGKVYTVVDKGQVFRGNNDRNTWKENYFSKPVLARFVRFYPRSWIGHISMRADVVSKIHNDVHPESSRKYSSVWKKSAIGTGFARSTLNSAECWRPQTDKVGEWMQIDLQKQKSIIAVITQRCKSLKGYVKSFKLKVSESGSKFIELTQLFVGNVKDNKMKINPLSKVTLARYIRFYPIEFVGHMALRADVQIAHGKSINPKEDARKYSTKKGSPSSMLDSTNGWIAGKAKTGEWIEINLGGRFAVVGVLTQGRHKVKEWVTSFTVHSSGDGMHFHPVDGGAVFKGNNDQDTRKENLFKKPVFARYVRITVRSWIKHPSMRASVLVRSISSIKPRTVNVAFQYSLSGRFEVFNAWSGEDWRFAKPVRTKRDGNFYLHFVSTEKGGLYRNVRLFPSMSSEIRLGTNILNYNHHFATRAELGLLKSEVTAETSKKPHGAPVPYSRVFRLPLRSLHEYPNGKNSAILGNGLAFYHVADHLAKDFNWGDPSSLKTQVIPVKGWKLEKNNVRRYSFMNDPKRTGTKQPFSKWIVGPVQAAFHIPAVFLQRAATNNLLDAEGNTGTEPIPIEVFDTTLVMIEAKVSFAHTTGHCGVADVVMCAYHAHNLQVLIGSCNATDNKGTAYVKVPYGLKVVVKYACKHNDENVCDKSDPQNPKDQETQMENKEKVDPKIGRDIRPVSSLGKLLEKPITVDTSSKVSVVYFVDYSTHRLDALVGYGPFHYGKPSRDLNQVKKDKKGLDLEKVIPLNKQFKGFPKFIYLDLLHNKRPRCNIMKRRVSRQYSLLYRHSLPYDIADQYLVRIHRHNDALHKKLVSFFPKVIKPHVIPNKKSQLKKQMFVLFEYRVKATLSIVLKDRSGKLSPVKKCNNQYYIDQKSGTVANHLEFYLSAVEKYVPYKFEAKMFNGHVSVADDVAFGSKSRLARNTKATIAKKSNVFDVRCGNTGCELDYIKASKKLDVLADAAYKVTRIAYPNIQPPWAKFIESTYTNKPGFPGLPKQRSKTLVHIVVFGLVPYRMHQTIKMPEFIPFLILRKPPGDGSFSQWAKHSAHTINLRFYKNGEEINGHGIAHDAEFGLGIDPSMISIPWIGKLLGAEGSLTLGVGGSLGFEYQKKDVMSYGNVVAFSSTLDIQTSRDPAFAGISGDLFLVPTLTIKVVESFIVFKDPKGGCTPKLGTASEWLALEGDKNKLEKLLVENRHIIDPVASYAKKMLQKFKKKKKLTKKEKEESAHYNVLLKASQILDPAVEDLPKRQKDAAVIIRHAKQNQAWNSATLHSLFHIITIRIPQLQRQCRELLAVMNSCLKSSTYSKFYKTKTAQLPYPVKVVNKVCKNTKSAVVNCPLWLLQNGIDVKKAPSAKNIFIGDIPQRIDITIRGVNGWRKTLLLNERLKEASMDNGFNMDQLTASPLDSSVSSVPHHHTAPATDPRGENVLAEHLYSLQDFLPDDLSSVKEAVKSGASKSLSYGISMGLEMLLAKFVNMPSEEEKEKYKKSIEARKKFNPASVIGFSGGGSVYSFSWSAHRSVPLGLDVDRRFKAEWSVKMKLKGDVEMVGEAENEPEAVPLSGDFENFWGKNRHETLGIKQEMIFHLRDDSDDDMFDVKVTRDPIYGTPVFKTLGGRSSCPHEQHTDNIDNFKIEFVRNELDYQGGTKENAKISVKKGSKCASAYLLLRNIPPGGEYARVLFIENKPAGLQFSLDGFPDDYHDLVLLDGENGKRKYLIRLCSFDNRVAAGKVFRGISITVASTCERDMKVRKFGLKEDGASYTECDKSGYPPAGAAHTNCVTFRDSFLVGSAAGKGRHMQFFEEPELHSRVVIDCLSFVGPCGCDKTKCQSKKSFLQAANVSVPSL